MNEIDIQSKIINATKWSTITEIASKLVSPITNMVLARILVPESFGVVATVTMIVSFAEMFTDSGFQKYLIQHEFNDEDEKYKSANIAFWTNFVIAIFLWGIIFVLCEQLATLLGNKGLGNVIAIACLQLPLTSFSSIQMALYRRDFNFKSLFIVRIIAVCIPFIITIPLALLGFGYWALIIGTLAVQFSNAILLTIKSKWKPKIYFSFKILQKMLSFSFWSLIEAISIWLTSWVDAFIIGSALNQYYLGLYKTSTTMVNSLLTLITASAIPVLFSSLSRMQNDEEKFINTFLKFQRLVSIIVLPLGIGLYLYSDLATKILLGNQWSEASGVIGIWGVASAITIVFSYFNSEVYRAKGRPKLSFVSQMLHLVVLVPVCIISSKYGFWALVYARSFVRIEGVIVGFIIMKFTVRFPVLKIFKNLIPAVMSTIAMFILGYFLKKVSQKILWEIISIIICALFYLRVLYLFPKTRKEIFTIMNKIKEY
jgi:PST family polysaccharide transporter